jgi:hypothetical protein
LQNKAYTIDITSRGRNPKSISHDSQCHIFFRLVCLFVRSCHESRASSRANLPLQKKRRDVRF